MFVSKVSRDSDKGEGAAIGMKKIKRPKCRGYMRHRWNPETGVCSRCKKVRNHKAKPLKGERQ